MIPLEIRKGVAAYYTNVLAAELLASLAIKESSESIADFASGSGGLLSAAYRSKRMLLKRPLTFEDHKRFVEHDLLGIDVMAFASHMTAINLSFQSPRYITNKVNVAIWDSTVLEPNVTIRSISQLTEIYRRFAKMYTHRGSESFTLQATMDTYTGDEITQDQKRAGPISFTGFGESITLHKYDTIIMNPPFTRQERLPNYYKDILEKRFSSYSEYHSGCMGYYACFCYLLISQRQW